MHITLAHIGPRAGSKDEFERLSQVYLERCSVFARCQSEAFRSEEAMLDWLKLQKGRVPALAVLLDSCGRQMSSEAFAGWLRKHRDEGAQQIVFAIGPADGWSDAARERAQLLLSLALGFTVGLAMYLLSVVGVFHSGADDAGSRAGPAGDGRTALPGIYNFDGPPLSRGALNSCYDRLTARTDPDQHRPRQG